MSSIETRNLVKRFGANLAVDDVSFDVEPGRVVALLGPSGCGKTTVLRMLAGLERPDAGSVHVAGAIVDDSARTFVPPERRGVGLVFQQYALFPHLNVEKNIGFGVREDTAARVEEMIALTRLASRRHARIDTLSGGEQQRVALARALAPAPAAVLLDEPFANLDARLRVEVREEVRAILAAAGATALLVTHDQEEALSLADEVVVMNAGRVLQRAAPDVLYAAPASLAVARLVGEGSALPVTDKVCPLGAVAEEADIAFVRPEWLTLDATGVPGTIVARRFTGPALLVVVELDGHGLPKKQRVLVRAPADAGAHIGDAVHVSMTRALLF